MALEEEGVSVIGFAQPADPIEPTTLREQWESSRGRLSRRSRGDAAPFFDNVENDEPKSGSLTRSASQEWKQAQAVLKKCTSMLRRSSSGVSAISSSLTYTTASKSSAGRRASIQSKSLAEIQEEYLFEQQDMRRGGIGTVVRFATRASDGFPVAIKVRHKTAAFEGDVREELRWLKTMRVQLDMPRDAAVCQLIEVIQTDTHYYTVMEKVEGHDLRSWWARSRKQLKHAIVQEIVKQILQGLQAMHYAKRVHRKIDLENVIVHMATSSSAAGSKADPRSEVRATLINFDSTVTWRESSKEKRLIGSHCYSAPETYEGQFSTASDIYSVGVLMYKLLTREFPVGPDTFDFKLGEEYVGSPSSKRVWDRLKKHQIDYDVSPMEACQEAAELCARLLAFRPEQRLSAEAALLHDWFALDILPERQA